MSQMFAVAKLAGMACKVKPERPRQRETELGGSDTHNLRWRAGIGSKHADLNYSNRPVRTRMPGGVGGARSGILTAPIPIVLKVLFWPTVVIAIPADAQIDGLVERRVHVQSRTSLVKHFK